jgi:ribosomal protein S18 acetylase RimI-like enzyme
MRRRSGTFGWKRWSANRKPSDHLPTNIAREAWTTSLPGSAPIQRTSSSARLTRQELAGSAGFARESAAKERHKGRIWGVYVSPRARGQGVGRRVLKAAVEHGARCPGIEQIGLQVRSNSRAHRLYASLGFRTFGWEKHALKIGDRYIDEEYMVLDLMDPEGKAAGL